MYTQIKKIVGFKIWGDALNLLVLSYNLGFYGSETFILGVLTRKTTPKYVHGCHNEICYLPCSNHEIHSSAWFWFYSL